MEEPHQNMLRELFDTVVGQINALNTELIAVKLKMQYVVKFRDKNSFICLNSSDVHEFHTYLAPLVYMDETAEHANFHRGTGHGGRLPAGIQRHAFGLLVRKIAKMDYTAACEAFSEFINDQSWNQARIVFIKKIVDYIVQNGYIDSPADLMKPPFDKPQNLLKLFDASRQKRIIEVATSIKDNAFKMVG